MVGVQTGDLSVNVCDCIPVGGECTGNPDSIGWSPHNVLHVVTQFAVFLHTNDLKAADATIHPGYLPRNSNQSQVCISGAKWALDLTPDNMYPSTCRLCVRTTRDLFVYRVVRYGNGRVRTSPGLCVIPCQQTLQASVKRDPAGIKTPAKKRKRGSSNVLDNSDGGDGWGIDNDNNKQMSGTAPKTPDVAGECIVSYEWFPRDLLVVVTLKGIFLIDQPNKAGDIDDDGKSHKNPLWLPPPAYSFSGSHAVNFRPSCATRVIGPRTEDMLLAVASPFFLRLFGLSVEGVHLVCCVRVPALSGVPASICCVQTGLVDREFRVFVSIPMSVVHGRIILCSATGERDNLPEGVPSGTNAAVVHEAAAEWQLTDVWGCESGLGDEIVVSRFVTVSLGTFAVKGLDFITPNSISGGAPFVILGVCRRRLFGFFGKSCISLITLTRMDQFVASDEEATELVGLALHPSCTLAIAAVQVGSRRVSPFQLFPCTAEREGGFLERLLYFQEGFASVFDCEEMLAHKPRELGLSRDVVVLGNLKCRQTSTSYFTWEGLLPRSALKANCVEGDAPRQRGPCRLPFISCQALLGGPDARPGLVATLRTSYLHLRSQYGVELFLRFPDSNASWRQTLIRLQRLSADSHVVTELILANAIQHVAEAVSYSGFSRGNSSRHALANDASSRDMAYAAALEFIRLYFERCKWKKSVDVAWSHKKEFIEQLGNFVSGLTERRGVDPKEEPGRVLHFPCSVCGEVEQNKLSLSLITKKLSAPQGEGESTPDCSSGFHISVFSGSSFVTLNFLSQCDVVSQCHACCTFDYAAGPLCGVCEGLMM